MTRATRGRPSKVDLLPHELKDELHKLLRDKSNTQLEILDAINELIDEHGLDESMQLSRSGLNRYATDMEKQGNRIREAREISKQWAEQLGSQSESNISQITIEMLRTIIFDLSLKLSDGDEISSEDLRNLTMSIARIERAAATGQKRIIEARKEFQDELAEKADKVVKEKGYTKEMHQVIMRDILGINDEI